MWEGCVTGANGVSRESPLFCQEYFYKFFTSNARNCPCLRPVFACTTERLSCVSSAPCAFTSPQQLHIVLLFISPPIPKWTQFATYRYIFLTFSYALPQLLLFASVQRHRAPVLKSVPPLVCNGGFQRSASPGSAQRPPPHVRTICQHMLFFALHIPRT